MRRRQFLKLSTFSLAGIMLEPATSRSAARTATLCLCGDVMTGRGIDQILPHPNDPGLHEPYAQSALDYVALAERRSGLISRPVGFAYPWGDALAEVERLGPDAWIANLETAVTRHDEPAAKSIHYRMHPENAPCLSAAGVDCWVLANNHTLDWGVEGLRETLATLRGAGLRSAGAGLDAAEAQAPASVPLDDGRRVLVFSVGSTTSGVPAAWAATARRPGVALLGEGTVARIAASVKALKRPGDLVVASVHWGGNWGHEIPRGQAELARRLVDEAGVDVVHGHSSHHPKAIEIYRGRPVLYGCGDFLNDYEGIHGHEEFRGELVLLYFVSVDAATGALTRLEMTPFRLARLRLNRASADEVRWLQKTLDRECAKRGTRVETTADGRLALRWE